MANEMRLIDAIAFGKALSEYYNATHIGMDSDYYEGMQAAVSNCIRFLEEQPSVDAIPVERLESFGKLFIAYTGDPRGPVGRMGWPGGDTVPDPVQRLEAEARAFGPLVDVDGGRWYPVLENTLEDLLRLARSAERKWIPVTERLPELHTEDYDEPDGSRMQFEVSDEQWVITASGDQTKARYENGVVFQGWVGDYGQTVRGVTHWTPLPEPPKGE